jgi:aminopeptidase N
VKFSSSTYFLIALSASALLTGCHTAKKTTDYNAPITVNLNTATVVAHPQYKGVDKKYWALTHLDLDVKPLWQTQQLQGKAILTVTPYAYPQDSLVLDAQDFTIESVKLNGKDLKYHYDKMQLHIGLGKTYNQSDTLKVHVDYIANPSRIIADSIAEKADEEGLFFINPEGKDTSRPTELWTQGETEHNSAWFPCIDATNQKFTQSISITVDDKYTTLSNGLLINSERHKDGTRTDIWKQDLPSAAYLSMIAVGNWKVVKDKWRNLNVDYYVEPEYEPYARMVFGNTPKMMEYFSRLLKYDYPWQKFSQVVARNFVSGAMENTTAVIHYEPLQHDARAHKDETYENVISHELFHHWFGDLVTCKGWANLALNESMATLGEYLWEEHANDPETVQLHRQQDLNSYLAEANISLKPIIQHYYVSPEDLFDRTRYEKGGLVFSMLRNYLGDTIFFKGLHNYLVSHAYGNVELADMRIAMENASGEDLNWFFNEWFEKPGHPVLDIKQKYDKQSGKVKLIVQQKQDLDIVPLYRMPVMIDIYTGHEVQHHKIWLAQKEDTFTFYSASAPLLLNFDAEKLLLCQKTEIKPASQWYYQYFHAANYADRYEAFKAISIAKEKLPQDSLNTFIRACLNDPSWYIRRLAIGSVLSYPSDKYVKDTLHTIIANKAVQDKNSKVRSMALNFLKEKDGIDAKPALIKAMNDSSYEVLATAIHDLNAIINRKDSAELLALLPAHELSRSAVVQQAIGEVYANYPSKARLSFFHHAPHYFYSYQFAQFIEEYKTVLLAFDVQTIGQEKDFILNLDNSFSEISSRIAYKNMLNELVKKLKNNSPKDQGLIDALSSKAEHVSLNAN